MEEKRYSRIAGLINTVFDKHANGTDQKTLASMLHTTQSSISKMKRGEVLPSEEVVRYIKYLWGIDISEIVEEERLKTRYNPPKVQTPKITFDVGIPYYDVDFIGGFDIVVNDQTTNPAYLINFRPYDKATCWCNITGHSMEPEINHGDIIALKKIEDISFLLYGEIYAIVTKNNLRTVKRLGKSDNPDCYMLVPSNKSPEYAPQEIRKDEILYVYEVMGSMKRF